MPTPDADPVRARLVGYAAALRAQGAVRSEAVERAFAGVRRDRCVTGFHTPDGVVEVPQDTVPPAEVLDRVYSDQALITHHGTDRPSDDGDRLVLQGEAASHSTPQAEVETESRRRDNPQDHPQRRTRHTVLPRVLHVGAEPVQADEKPDQDEQERRPAGDAPSERDGTAKPEPLGDVRARQPPAAPPPRSRASRPPPRPRRARSRAR
jgi:hypothetical protein